MNIRTQSNPRTKASSPSLHVMVQYLAVFILLAATGCSGAMTSSPATVNPIAQVATPVIVTTPAQNGAVIISFTDTTPHATIFYTTNGTAPNASSVQYLAPFLVASNITVQAIAESPGITNSAIASQTFAPEIPSGTLIWSDEFSNTTGAIAQPNPTIWGYDTGGGGWGNSELETYCAWGSTAAPCSTTTPNAYVGTDGYLHIVAAQPSPGVYTSARVKSQGLFSFQYGRLEFRAQMPEAQGLWPAGWLLGNTVATINWPACGEQDVLERVNAAANPDDNVGSVHGPGFTGSLLGTTYLFPAGVTATTWHTYGMIWKPGTVSYYVDDPANIYVTYSASSLVGLSGATWPFDGGQSNFIILNLAIGGAYPGAPNATTPFPAQMLIDYVRLYTN